MHNLWPSRFVVVVARMFSWLQPCSLEPRGTICQESFLPPEVDIYSYGPTWTERIQLQLSTPWSTPVWHCIYSILYGRALDASLKTQLVQNAVAILGSGGNLRSQVFLR